MSNRLLRSLRRLAPPQAEGDDAALLERFARLRDEAAFEAIVRRHGGMVRGVCRRRLACPHDVEDAFQAVFLVLARDAARIGRRESLPGWLYRVALLTALKLLGRNARRRSVPLPDEGPVAGDDVAAEAGRRELRAILEEELAELPDRLRAAAVLCYLEGHSNSEAAALLGCPRGTVDSRLAAARQRLLGRLLRRGVVPAGGAETVEAALQEDAAAAVGLNGLVEKTVLSAIRYTTGGGTSAADPVTTLADGMSPAMSLNKLHLLAAVTLTLTLLGGGVGLYLAAADGKPDAAPAAKKSDPAAPAAKDATKPAEKSKPVEAEAEAAPRKFSSQEVQALLREPFKAPPDGDNLNFKELLQYLSDVYGVPIRIDIAAFRRVGVENPTLMYDQRVPVVLPRGMSLGDLLKEVLAQIRPDMQQDPPPVQATTYRIRDGAILIVPAYIPAPSDGGELAPAPAPVPVLVEQEYGEPVSLFVEETPFAKVLEELRRLTGANIVLDARQKDKATMEVSATFTDVRLLTALRVLGDMCDLKPVAVNNVYYLTSRENAERLERESGRGRTPGPMATQLNALGGIRIPK